MNRVLRDDKTSLRLIETPRPEGCLDSPERLELSGRLPKYREDQRIYSWIILYTRDQTKLRFTRAFTATIKAQVSLGLLHATSPSHSPILFNSLIGSFIINYLVNRQ